MCKVLVYNRIQPAYSKQPARARQSGRFFEGSIFQIKARGDAALCVQPKTYKPVTTCSK